MMEPKPKAYPQRDTKQLIWNALDHLTYQQQQKLLDFINSLVATPKEGHTLLQFAGTIPKDDLHIMKNAIEDGNKIDYDEW